MMGGRALLALILLVPVLVLASSSDPHAIPWKTIWVQAFNFVLFIGLMVYASRKSVVDFFTARHRDYHSFLEQAQSARRQAEQNHGSIRAKLQALEANSRRDLDEARDDAEGLKAKTLKEARILAEKLVREASETQLQDLARARAEIRAELLNRSVAAAERRLESSLDSAKQKKLQSDFVERMQAVRT